MKVLLLCPSFYTLHRTLQSGFEKLGLEVHHHDYRHFLKSWQAKTNVQIFRLPYSYRKRWDNYYFAAINQKHREVFEHTAPDLVFIYNSEGLLPDTIAYFRSRKAKILFIMGDSPYYTFTNPYYLHLLFQSDMIVSPDSMWAEQLQLLGIKRVAVDFPGFSEQLSRYRNPTDEERHKYNFDVLFMGTGYPDVWGYKRTLYVSRFASLSLKAFGTKHWIKWMEFFPELKPKFHLLTSRISDEELVVMSKCAKVYPVDANPGLLNGVHLRIFDCIASGILPIAEYRKDQEMMFDEVELPIIRDYDNAEQLALKYITNDDLRERTLRELHDFVFMKYSSSVALKRILSQL